MFGALWNRLREGKLLRRVTEAAAGRGAAWEGLEAARLLRTCGTARSVPALCAALTQGPDALRTECAAALAAMYTRHPDEQVLRALNAAIASERQPENVRVAAVEQLAGIVDARHARQFVELLVKRNTPLVVCQAAFGALVRLGYPELLDRLVESYLFHSASDGDPATRQWAVGELKALGDKQKLTKIHEIVHGRRRLDHYAVNADRGDLTRLILLMAQVEPQQSVRFLSQMQDHSTRVISSAAAAVLRKLRDARGDGTPSPPTHPASDDAAAQS